MGMKLQTIKDRSPLQAMGRGALCRCPNCGQGHMFRAFLKVADVCDNCGEELYHHRADDFPPYLAIMIVGHILIGIMLHMDMSYHVNPMVYLYTMVPLAIIMPLAILPSLKGAIVGMQWATRMHGFDPAHQD
jgi:uncharacterized protein (DUF983 family)